MDDVLLPALEERRIHSLYRKRTIIDGPQAVQLRVAGRELINFCSNDYLGLASHPDVIAALKQGAEVYGVGAGASHLVNGHSRAHHALEEELSAFVQRPRALLFSTGYMANLGVVSTLIGRGDVVLEDRLNHASLIDAGLLSGAKLQRYLHGDSQSVQQHLVKWQAKNSKARCLIATDGVFSMDGDLAPLADLAESANKYDAWLMVDDAHGLGVLGKHGRGSLEYFDLDDQQVPILMGTLGKALGTFGAFVAGSEVLIETLVQQSRSYIYTTALPPAVAEATRASLKLVKNDSWRREKLQTLIKRFRNGAKELGLMLMDSHTPIQPVVIGDAGRTMAISQALNEYGFYISAIRPPTVPEGSSRLRITLSAMHTEEQVDQLLEALDAVQ
jgi:8-amino-7-oxononanoate synthase